MRHPRRRIFRERIPLDARSSFSVTRFKQTHYPFQWHYHPEAELTLIVKGRGLRFVGDGIAPYEEGDLCFLGAGLPHTWQSDPNDGRVESLVIQFLPKLWGESFERLPESSGLSRLFSNAGCGLEIGPSMKRRVIEQMLRMERAAAGSLDRMLALLECCRLLTEATDLTPLSVMAFNIEDRDEPSKVLTRVLDRLHKGEGDDLPSQADLAKLVHMSPQSFSRFFKRQVGKPFVQYVNEWRVSRACRDLLETDEPITQIAYSAGFENLSNFNRRFRLIKQMTPREFRQLPQANLK